MLFDRNIDASCAYCHHGTALGRDEFICIKHGIMHGSGYCRSFRYEPTKRIPPVVPSLDTSGVSDEDFML